MGRVRARACRHDRPPRSAGRTRGRRRRDRAWHARLGGLRRHAARLPAAQRPLWPAHSVPVRHRGRSAVLWPRAIRLGARAGLPLGRGSLRGQPRRRADRAPSLPPPSPDGRIPPVVLPCARRRRAAEPPHHPPPDLGGGPRRKARRQRGGVPGERRHGGRRPRDRHVRPHRERGQRQRGIAAAPAEPVSGLANMSTSCRTTRPSRWREWGSSASMSRSP